MVSCSTEIISKVNCMVICNNSDFGYDTPPGDQPGCRSGERSGYFRKNSKKEKLKWDPGRCNYVGREQDCPFFETGNND